MHPVALLTGQLLGDTQTTQMADTVSFLEGSIQGFTIPAFDDCCYTPMVYPISSYFFYSENLT
jgi:hypothetical protein